MSDNKGYLVRHIMETQATQCPCGESLRMITVDDNNLASIHVVTISRDSKLHYHKILTEFYYVLEGEGLLELNDDLVEIAPGTLVMIKPMTKHRARGKLKILNIVTPPFREDDEFVVSESNN